MKEQNLDFEVARDFFIKTKYYIIKMNLLSIGIVHDHAITQHIYCIMLLCFLSKDFVISLFCYQIGGIYTNTA